jgi:DNA polymerase-3 subunit beta
MKIICSVVDLRDQLEKLALACNAKYSTTLSYVLVESFDSTIRMTTTDLSVSLATTVVSQVVESGSGLLPCKQLLSLLKVLAADEVVLTINDEICLVQTNTGNYKLPSEPFTNFPNLPTIQDGDTYQLEAKKQLTEGIKAVLFSASTDETKSNICGVHLTMLQGHNLEFAATNGHTLALIESVSEYTNSDTEFTIPNQTCLLLQKLLEKVDDVKITVKDSDIAFEFDNYKLTSRLMVGQYPKYNQLFPRQFDKKLTVDRVALLDAVEKIQVISSLKNNGVIFNLSPENQEINLTSQVTDVGITKISLPAQISGDSLKTAFYCPYLVSVLKNLTSTEVQINLNAKLTPVVFSPLSTQKIKYLVMPLQIKD